MEKIKLSQIVAALEMTDQNNNGYLHKETFEIVFVSDDEFRELEMFEESNDLELSDWQILSLNITRDVANSNNYYSLPSSYDIHEHMIMQKYCYSLDEELARECLNSIFRSGAFKRFKAFVHNKGLTNDWYLFRTKEYLEIAREWLEDNEIEYLDDTSSKYSINNI